MTIRSLCHLALTGLVIALSGCATLGLGGAAAPRVAPDSFAVTLMTTKGRVDVMMHRAWAPQGVDRFYQLARERYYDGARFYRVVPNFVVQWGLAADPAKTAKYKPLTIPDDSVRTSNLRGTVSFARGARNSRTAQLFVNLVDNPRLDRDSGFGFPPIGRVTAGMDVVDRLNAEWNGKMPGSVQDSIVAQGNAWLDRAFPRLDGIVSLRITREWKK